MSRKAPTNGRFPRTRLRRMRRDEFSRRLMRETRLSVDDLIQPLFVIEARTNPRRWHRARHRLSIDRLLASRDLVTRGVPAVAFRWSAGPRRQAKEAHNARDSRNARCVNIPSV